MTLVHKEDWDAFSESVRSCRVSTAHAPLVLMRLHRIHSLTMMLFGVRVVRKGDSSHDGTLA